MCATIVSENQISRFLLIFSRKSWYHKGGFGKVVPFLKLHVVPHRLNWQDEYHRFKEIVACLPDEWYQMYKKARLSTTNDMKKWYPTEEIGRLVPHTRKSPPFGPGFWRFQGALLTKKTRRAAQAARLDNSVLIVNLISPSQEPAFSSSGRKPQPVRSTGWHPDR